MTEPRLENQTIKVRQLIEEYRAGRIVIPEFQRDYVWKKGRAPKLIDSLYRGFPVSSLLLWQSSDEIRARRRDPRPSRGAGLSWLIDGQQRVTTLARAHSGDEDIDVVFHPEQDEFSLQNAATKNDQSWFRLADIWDDEHYRTLRRNLDGARGADKREAAFERVRRILDYEIPYVRMVDHSFLHAVDAFTRINTLGMKLKKEDIEAANVAAQHTGFIADEVAPFLQQLRAQGFARMNVMHLFRACAFIAQPDGRARTPLHELSRTAVASAWQSTVRGTEEATGIIRSELGLVNMDILWSGALVVPVIALCATLGPRKRNAAALCGWLALAALHHRYSGSAETTLDQDLRACRSDDPIGALLTNLRRSDSDLRARPSHFSGAIADRSSLLAAYVACRKRGLIDFFTDQKVLLQGNVDRHHILPRAQFELGERSKSDCIANIAFIAGGSNKSLGPAPAESYLKKISRKTLTSQCIPLEESLWAVERASDFWEARKALLAEGFNEYLDEALPGRRL
jgi:hypothetical protein